MKVAVRTMAMVLAVAAGAARAQTADYVRETTTPHDPGTGFWLWWGSRDVTFQVNATSASPAPCLDASAARAMVESSVPQWNSALRTGETQACTDFRFVVGGSTTNTAVGNDCMNLIVFRSGRCQDIVPLADPCRSTAGACATKYNCWEHDNLALSTIALTTTTFDNQTGELLDADVELFGWTTNPNSPPNVGWFFTCASLSDPPCGTDRTNGTTCNATDVGTVVIHESGHMLGLDHVCTSEYPEPTYNAICPADGSVMTPGLAGVASRKVYPADADGICAVYPKGGATSTSFTTAPAPRRACDAAPQKSGGGCASGPAGLIALLGVALTLPLRRRARR